MPAEARGVDMPTPLLFAYWGRRGAGPTLTQAMVRAAQNDSALAVSLSFARQGERAAELSLLTPDPIAIDTFSNAAGALAATIRLPSLHRRLAAEIRARRIAWVITVMPHLWSRLLASAAHTAGARYAVIAHDASQHPGEESWLLDRLATAEIRAADRVIAFSDHVAHSLTARHGPLPLATLFHPPFDFGAAATPRRQVAAPVRLLFFGRILPYKGLELLLAAYRLLRVRGLDCELSIVGEGSLSGPDLSEPGIAVHNRWIPEHAIPGFLENADILIAPYLEASQSGVIAAAQAACLPTVATPVGGLTEQVASRSTGLIARAVSAEAVADAILELAGDRDLYAACSAGAFAAAQSRGWPVFIEQLKSALA